MRYTAEIRRYLEENPNKFVDIVTLRGLTYPTLHEKQVQNAISRIKQHMKNEDTFDELQTISRGEVWRYVPYGSNPERVTVKLTEADNPKELDRQNKMEPNSLATVEEYLDVTAETRWWWHGMSSPEGKLLLACDNGRYYVAREL